MRKFYFYYRPASAITVETHVRLTGSRVARSLLRNDPTLASFCRVTSARLRYDSSLRGARSCI